MNIKVWTSFTKRKNSTAQPTGGTQKNVYLKEGASILNPSFILAEPATQYTYVEAFGHYYFVRDVVNLDASRSEIICVLDPLATYKSDITGYTAFVERAASSYDVWINDPLLSQEQLYVNDDITLTSLSSIFSVLAGGCFIVECLAKDNGVVLYATSTLEPYKFILTPGAYSPTDKSQWIQSSISQAFDLDVYIGSVKWFPFSESGLNGTLLPTNSFPIGPVDLAAAIEISDHGAWTYSVYKIDQKQVQVGSVTLSLPSTNNFNDFRDCNNQYTQYTMYLPGVGIVNVDSSIIGYAIKNSKTINVNIYSDLISGEITYLLQFSSGAQIGRYSGNISVDVPIGKSAVDTVKSAKMFAGSVATGAMRGGWIGAIGGAIAGGVEAIYNHMTPDTSMVGGSGNKTEIVEQHNYISLNRRQYGSRYFPTSVAGRPLMQNVTLSTLSGYVKCGNASVPVNAPDSVRDEINSFLNSGFYIE